MKNNNSIISQTCRRRLNTQGYQAYSDEELFSYKYGIRFAPGLCAMLAGLGLITNNLATLIFVATVAFLGMLFKYHPFDYLYNIALRNLINKPKLPPRTNQGRFACGLASLFLAITIYLFYNNFIISGYLLGGFVVAVATLVSTTDVCIPSIIYNFLFRSKLNEKNTANNS